ncbi:MAG: hypothetical protein KQI62_04875 [Deltaproteobacteria bacterium]|nr:hypothetical protein [Deltaproteobacteria bacterium]
MPEVYFRMIDFPNQSGVDAAVDGTLEFAGLTHGHLGKRCPIKINALLREILQNSSWGEVYRLLPGCRGKL